MEGPRLDNVSRLSFLRHLVRQRLHAVAEDICGLLEGTFAVYEDELSRLKENDQQLSLLDAAFQPNVHLRRSGFPANIQQMWVKEEVPTECRPSLDQDQDPEPLHIKEQQKELSQGGEEVNGLEEADITRFPFTAVHLKSGGDEEEPQSSQLHQCQAEDNREAKSDGEDCGGSEPVRYLDPRSPVRPDTDKKASDSPETDVSNDDDDWQEPLSESGAEPEKVDSDWKETGAVGSGLNVLTYNKSLLPFACEVCGKGFNRKKYFQRHMKVHTGEKAFGCDVCGKRFHQKTNLTTHMRVHTGEKPFGCHVCGKKFNVQSNLQRHLRGHTRGDLFGTFGKRFN